MASHIGRLTAVFLASVACLPAAPVLAQAAQETQAPVYIDADRLDEIEGGAGYIARGNVRARQGERTLTADELEYRPELNRVIARGDVVIYGQGPFPQYADEVELDSELAAGIAIGFATMLENNGRMAAAAAIRRESGTIELEDAYYTACELCEDGEREPTWRLRAREVIQDAEDQMIYYRDAQFEVMGVPVLYAPVFAHADPSSERRSGFLFPAVGASSRLGLMYQQPYYWAISPHQDITIAPRVMSKVNPLLYTEYRRRFWSGQFELEGSITDEFEIDSDGERFGDKEIRWHLFGGGEWNINPDWRWGFGVQRTSDDLHIRRYDFSEVDKDRGAPLTALNRQLVSQIYVEGRTRNRFTSIIAASYQSLRTFEDDDTLPDLAPLVSMRQVFDAPEGWGRINLDASAAVLQRETGADYQRASAALDWRTRWVSDAGIVVQPFAYGRADTYSYDNVPAGSTASNEDFSRAVGLAGAEISWPFYRAGEQADWIVEPVVSAIAATDDPERARILNEDSLTFDLDESLVFRPVRAPGYDLWEEGQRLNYGIRATAQWGRTGFARVFAGQSQRVDGNPTFGAGSGVFEDSSDYVVAGEIDIAGFGLDVQTRLDSDDGDVNRLDMTASYRGERFDGRIRYLDVSDDASLFPAQRELRADLSYEINDRWSAIARVTRDLDLDVSRRQETGFRYQDECTQFEIVYERQDLGINQLGPSESIQVRIALFTLGSLNPE